MDISGNYLYRPKGIEPLGRLFTAKHAPTHFNFSLHGADVRSVSFAISGPNFGFADHMGGFDPVIVAAAE